MPILTKWMMPFCLNLLLLTVPSSSANGQDSQTMCVTKTDFLEAVHAECRDARAAADRYATCRDLLAAQQVASAQCTGKLSVLADERAMRVMAERLHERAVIERYSVWTVATVGVLGVVVGVVVGYLASP